MTHQKHKLWTILDPGDSDFWPGDTRWLGLSGTGWEYWDVYQACHPASKQPGWQMYQVSSSEPTARRMPTVVLVR